ncbi:GrpB family protein [Peribacillus deserti]|uniref:GrpB family protein n=1 Tax=Peribacillus deserti TaxID=673318 RepID=UPI00115A32B9|nr:GrpB family protein [Peribacillus deserti]
MKLHIEISDYNEKWSDIFFEIKRVINHALGDLIKDIEMWEVPLSKGLAKNQS